MTSRDWRLLNAERLEALPAALARARGNSTARALAHADWLIRRKSDGRFLAVRCGDRTRPLWRGALPATVAPDLHRLAAHAITEPGPLALTGLMRHLAAVGLDPGYGERTGLALQPEPGALHFAGFDRYRRALWLTAAAARAWQRMRAAARSEAVLLEAISGYRSHDYQLGIFRRKLARGQSLAQILAVNAAPGYSEHHSGEAIDIGTPGEPPAEPGFEATPAFAWLRRRAPEFGFHMSYPRDNPHGIDYEPWHWRWRGRIDA